MRAAIAAYHHILEEDPAGAVSEAERMARAFAAQGVTYGGQPMQSFLRPHLVARAEWDRLRGLGTRLLEVAARAARHAFDGDVGRLFEFLGTPDAEARWVALDQGPPDVELSRLDAFVGADGRPRFIEINSDAPAGLGYGDRMAAVIRSLPSFARFAAGRRVDYQPSAPAVVEVLVSAWRRAGGAGAPAVAIVDWSEVKTRPDQEILRESIEGAGLRCALADPRDARLQGGRLWFGDDPADVVYRRAVLSELVEREAEVAVFFRAYRDRAAVFVNSFRCRLSEDKAFFAVLTDEAFAHLLDAEEQALVARCVPWTRRVAERRTTRGGTEVDLVPHVLAERERLVLKPAHAYGGHSVRMGDETPPAEWEAVVHQALSEPWVVQERVTIPEEPFPVVEGGALRFEPMKVNVNPFYAGGAEVGAVTRASRGAIINVSAGGGSVPTFVVE